MRNPRYHAVSTERDVRELQTNKTSTKYQKAEQLRWICGTKQQSRKDAREAIKRNETSMKYQNQNNCEESTISNSKVEK